jgi:Tfp pilus assembly protein PilN
VIGRRREWLQTLTKQEQTYQTLRPEVRALLRRQKQLEHRLHDLEELALARTLTIQAFQQITEALPDEIWLTKIEISKGPPAGGAAQEGGTIDGVLEGYSRSFQGVTRLMDQLKTTVGWTTVRPLSTSVATDPTTKDELIAFTVQVQQPLSVTKDAAPQGPLPSPRGAKSRGTQARPARSVERKPAKTPASSRAGKPTGRAGASNQKTEVRSQTTENR